MSGLTNKKNIHVVIDIEALGRVVTLQECGGCDLLQAAFRVVRWASNMQQWVVITPENNNFHFDFPLVNTKYDAATMDWWENESRKELYRELFLKSNEYKHTGEFSDRLNEYVAERTEEGYDVHYWSRGKDYDFPLLTAHAERFKYKAYPFTRSFWATHCLRDLEFFINIKPETENVRPHDAEKDAKHEAEHLQTILNTLTANKGNRYNFASEEWEE